jgi:hypothetical protein
MFSQLIYYYWNALRIRRIRVRSMPESCLQDEAIPLLSDSDRHFQCPLFLQTKDDLVSDIGYGWVTWDLRCRCFLSNSPQSVIDDVIDDSQRQIIINRMLRIMNYSESST